MDKTAIRDAATVILVRHATGGAEVLMGQRGSAAAFMPNKFVFPGGAVDRGDATVPLGSRPPAVCAARLEDGSVGTCHGALVAAAIRELWEETGLALGEPGVWPAPVPEDWQSFAARGVLPSARGLRFIFRAITPPGRPRRFDARFFLADAGAVAGDVNDFSDASDELSHLQWIPLDQVRSFDLPFITEVVLAEVAALIRHDNCPDSVPFFDNSGDVPSFRRLV